MIAGSISISIGRLVPSQLGLVDRRTTLVLVPSPRRVLREAAHEGIPVQPPAQDTYCGCWTDASYYSEVRGFQVKHS